MKKRFIAILLAASMLTGCGGGNSRETDRSVDNAGKRWEETEDSTEEETQESSREESREKPAGTGESSLGGLIGALSGQAGAESAGGEQESVPGFDDHVSGTVYTQTVMIYVVGSDLESEYGNATMDFEEMQLSLPDLSKHNVVVLAGGTKEWQNDVMEGMDGVLLRFVENGVETEEVPNANMGEADTLSGFIRDTMQEYDTDLYSLILWDHGGGPVCGFGVDENYQDVLTLDELQKAMRDSVGKSGRKLEFVGFDACLMNSMEVADVFAPYANYLVASQETEPGWGWNYEFLKALDEPDMNGAAVGRRIIENYMDFGDKVFELYPKMYADLTLSCLDLSKYQAAEDALNDFFEKLDGELDRESFPRLVRARGETKDFGNYSTTFDYGMVDAVHLIEQLAGEDEDAREAVAAIEDMVVHTDSNTRNTSGVSICYPHETNEQYSEACLRMQEKMGFAEGYTRFLKDFRAIGEERPAFSDWDLSKAKTEVKKKPVSSGSASMGSDITLALSEEQQENFGSAEFYILCDVVKSGMVEAEKIGREDAYVCVYRGQSEGMDEDGVLHAEYSNSVVYIKSGETGEICTDMPVILREMETTPEEKRYFSVALLQRFTDWEMVTAQLQIVVSDEYPDGFIRSAVPVETSELPMGASKQLLDLDDYDAVSFACKGRYLTRDEDGRMEDYYDWEQSTWILGVEIEPKEGDSLTVEPIQNPENYFCQFIIRDASGNVTYSELIPLK